MAFNILEALAMILELEGKVEDLINQAKDYIAHAKDEKTRKAMLEAWESRKTDPVAAAVALRKLMFEEDN
jgi:predicted ATP-grasp superfamily ATP-dependent carboligase